MMSLDDNRVNLQGSYHNLEKNNLKYVQKRFFPNIFNRFEKFTLYLLFLPAIFVAHFFSDDYT
jgi:hypothetical protein